MRVSINSHHSCAWSKATALGEGVSRMKLVPERFQPHVDIAACACAALTTCASTGGLLGGVVEVMGGVVGMVIETGRGP